MDNLTDILHKQRYEHFSLNRIDSVMLNVLVSSVVDRGFKTRRLKPKIYKTSICCFSAIHASLRSKS